MKQRKKQPEQVKKKLLEAAGEIAASQGVAAITLDAVAKGAGVSKGGLLHHFPGRQVLVAALCASILEQWDRQLQLLIDADTVPEGRFTRAYLRSTVSVDKNSDYRLMMAVTMAMSTDEALRKQWNGWLDVRAATQGGEENTLQRRMVRAAADGIWLADFTGANLPDRDTRAAMVEKLVGMTF